MKNLDEIPLIEVVKAKAKQTTYLSIHKLQRMSK